MSTEIAIALKLYKYQSNMQQQQQQRETKRVGGRQSQVEQQQGHADMATTQSNPVIAF